MAPKVIVVEQGCTVGRVFIYFLRFLKLLAIIALLADIVSYCLSMKGAILTESMNNYTKSFFVLSSVGFCLMALVQIVAEFEPIWFFLRVKIMKYWIVRGFLLGWQGIQTISSSEVVGGYVTEIDQKDFKLAGDIVGWTLIAIGFLYILMSTLCLKRMCGLQRPDDIKIRLVSDEKMERFGSTIGVTVEGDYERERSGGGRGASGALSPEARAVISNMAIALDITSSRAWDMFNGPAGAEEARRMRAERALAAAASTARDRFDEYQAPVVSAAVSMGGGGAATLSTAPPSARATDDDVDNPRARRMLDTDADLEAQYYASLQQP